MERKGPSLLLCGTHISQLIRWGVTRRGPIGEIPISQKVKVSCHADQCGGLKHQRI